MTYREATEYLFNIAPLFQNVGKDAYKEGLDNTLIIDEHFGKPHNAYRKIHVAGTNGKGSCCHTIAAILQEAGYKVGLYTSPHLLDFRERIRVNGIPIPEQRVIDFVVNERGFFEPLHPSFFELTTNLAFLYFEEQKVDVAVIEVGLGGRLDCTNIITPDLSIITNISFDHTEFLGDTLQKIAMEKAGIIKDGIPIVIGETNGNAEVRGVFLNTANAHHSDITFADESDEVTRHKGKVYDTRLMGKIYVELCGFCQEKNTATILSSIRELRRLGFPISDDNISKGFANVCYATGLMGRWQKVSDSPTVICDTGHNPAGLSYIGLQLRETQNERLHIVIGMAGDKDVRESLSYLPQDATYYFTQASVKRAMKAEDIASIGNSMGLTGESYGSVMQAFTAAKAIAGNNDLIFVGGSSFVVADFLISTM